MPFMVPALAAIGGGSALAGGLLAGGTIATGLYGAHKNSSAINKATAASNNAAADTNATNLQIFNTNKETLSPFVGQGTQANGQINALLGSNPFSASTGATFQADPGYQFQRDEGLRGLASSAAFGGALRSGGAVKDAIRFNSGLADQGYSNFWNRDQAQLTNNNNQKLQYLNALYNQQQLGMGAASAQAGVGQNFANATANNNWQNASNLGNAAIAGANNSNALLGNLLNTGAGLYGMYRQGGGGMSSFNVNPPAPIPSWSR